MNFLNDHPIIVRAQYDSIAATVAIFFEVPLGAQKRSSRRHSTSRSKQVPGGLTAQKALRALSPHTCHGQFEELLELKKMAMGQFGSPSGYAGYHLDDLRWFAQHEWIRY
jgi:hypothetical protein